MTARPLRDGRPVGYHSGGLQAIRDAVVQAPPAIHVLILDGLPRTGLSVKEVAKITGHKYDRILREIRNGRLRADREGQGAVIPVSELAEIAKWADYEHGP